MQHTDKQASNPDSFTIWLSHQDSWDVSSKTIFRLPKDTKLYDKRSYVPTIVPIGPYHHVHKSLTFKEIEAHKKECVSYLLSLAPHKGRSFEELTKDCLAELEKVENQARNCYSEDMHRMKSEHFRQVLMRDGCFIINLLLLQSENIDGTGQDSMNSQGIDEPKNIIRPQLDMHKLKDIKLDLLKFENQIPFFVIATLVEYIKPKGLEPYSLVVRMKQLFANLLPFQSNNTPELDEVHHILHLIHILLLPNSNRVHNPEPWAIDAPNWIPSAKELQESGICFKPKHNAKNILDIGFDDDTIKMRTLNFNNPTALLFCNLIAFEQSFTNIGAYTTSYVLFLKCLMHSEEDVRLLQLSGVVKTNHTSDRSMVEFFRQICPEGLSAASKPNCLHDLFVEITYYRKRRMNRWIAEAKRKYCSSPWVTISVIAACFLFVLTALQTIFAGMQTFN